MTDDWKIPGQVAGNKLFAILGNKTMAENYKYWVERWQKGEGIVHPGEDKALPHGPHHAKCWPPGWKPGDEKAPPRPPRDLKEELHLHLTRVAVPERLAMVLEAGPEERPAISRVREWFKGTQSICLLHGHPGGGKSLAAASVFLLTQQTGWDGHDDWDSAGAFVDAIDIAGNLFRDETRSLVEYVEETPVLVMDELGAETMSDPWLGLFETIVNKRFGNPRLRTVLVTNISAKREGPDKPSEFERRYGGRVARRIRESGLVLAVGGATT